MINRIATALVPFAFAATTCAVDIPPPHFPVPVGPVGEPWPPGGMTIREYEDYLDWLENQRPPRPPSPPIRIPPVVGIAIILAEAAVAASLEIELAAQLEYVNDPGNRLGSDPAYNATDYEAAGFFENTWYYYTHLFGNG